MDDSDKPKFSVAIAALLVTFGREATVPQITGYWLGLRDLPLVAVEAAVAKAMQTATRIPVPAELRELASGGSSSDRAIAAWSDVQRACSVSYMADLDFADWLINAVIRNLGGRWNFFDRLNAGAESEKWLRVDFLKVYAMYAQTLPSDEATCPLIGQASHGTVAGRTHQPRLVIVQASDGRPKLLPQREKVLIQGPKVSNVPRVEFQKS